MTDYRDPFDLSQAPKTNEKKQAQKKHPKSKAVVKRVSIGPLLHSRFTKLLTTIGLVILIGLLSYTATFFYLSMRK